MASPHVRFLIGGVQKGGTTALARYLSNHPQLALPTVKEAHVFDRSDFDDAWTPAQVDAMFAPLFGNAAPDALHGDATPITLFQPVLVQRVARYHPGMRWIVLLRDPVERAISHYFMERGRGLESRSLTGAVLAERWRLRGHRHDWSADSPLRTHSYVARGRYCRQLDELFRRFPREQVLLLRSADLARDPASVVDEVLRFLQVQPFAQRPDYRPVFEGRYAAPGRWAPGLLLLRWRLRGEIAALARRYGVDLRAPGSTVGHPPR
jgi:hypothetical protein